MKGIDQIEMKLVAIASMATRFRRPFKGCPGTFSQS